MNAETLQAAADAQKPLVDTEITKQSGLGAMSRERWETLGKQLADLKMIERAPDASQVFVAPSPK